ncbi:hypothetical protein ACFWCB_35510 [Streptomyces sp. NPDC060048]|uniref:hypothetical protein n=1 Tax=unclassified Streptomyces TaxID=2593676 RepID=UPI0036C4C85B
MTIAGLNSGKSVPTAQEVRRQVARTRKELGRTVTALASKADAAVRAQGRTASSKRQVAQVTGRLRKAAAHVGRLAGEKNLDSLRGKAGRAASAARTDRTKVIAIGGVLAAVLLVRRTLRARRGPSGHR